MKNKFLHLGFDSTTSLKETLENIRNCPDIEPVSLKSCDVISPRKIGKTVLTIEHLQGFLEMVPEKVKTPRILIVGKGFEPNLSKQMKFFLEAAQDQGVEVHFMSSLGGSVDTVFKLNGGQKFDFLTGTPDFNLEQVLNRMPENQVLVMNRVRPFILEDRESFLQETFIPKEKHVPIKGKSSKKGKSQLGSKFHR